MSITKITFDNKQTLASLNNIQIKNKIRADDVNEIKSVVNTNADKLGDLDNLNTTDKDNIIESINEVLTDISSLTDELFYKVNDTYTPTSYVMVYGCLTGAKKYLKFVIPTLKSLKNITNITTSGTLKLDIRKPSGGYIAQNVDFLGGGYSVTCSKSNDYAIILEINSTSDFDDTNNMPLTADLLTGVTFNFS